MQVLYTSVREEVCANCLMAVSVLNEYPMHRTHVQRTANGFCPKCFTSTSPLGRPTNAIAVVGSNFSPSLETYDPKIASGLHIQLQIAGQKHQLRM